MTEKSPSVWALVMWDRDDNFDAIITTGSKGEVDDQVATWPSDRACYVTAELVQSSARKNEVP